MKTPRSRSIELMIVVLLLILAFIDAWAGRRSYAAGDTVSYMDMASGIATGNFSAVVSGHWSPLYPAILSAFIWPFQSDSLREFSAVRIVNFLIFGGALLVFHLSLKKFRDVYFRQYAPAAHFVPLLSPLQFTIVAYAIFAWGCFSLTLVSRVNPDICVAAVTFGVASVLLGFTEDRVSRTRFVAFGALLGVGYLFKAIFFPISVFLVVIAALDPGVRRVRPRLVLTLTTFLVLASPLVITLTQRYGHPTFGESARLSYWWEILKVNPGYVHWQGEPPGSGIPLHPTRKILDRPTVYEFAYPKAATYPPWFDPTYWNAGATVRFDASRQVNGIAANLRRLGTTLVRGPFSAAVLAVLILVLIGWRHVRISFATVRNFRSLWLFGLGNLVIYLLVLIDTRYLAGCLPLLAILFLTTLEARTPAFARPFSMLVVTLAVLGIGLQVGPRLARAAMVIIQTGGDVRDENWLVAREFHRLSVPAGIPVAAINERDDQHWSPARISDWARLARVHVVSEVVNDPQFWRIPPDAQAAALQALSQTGARIVVASGVPPDADTAGWSQIEGSGYFYRFLQNEAGFRTNEGPAVQSGR